MEQGRVEVGEKRSRTLFSWVLRAWLKPHFLPRFLNAGIKAQLPERNGRLEVQSSAPEFMGARALSLEGG
jgi:hypothetical protein